MEFLDTCISVKRNNAHTKTLGCQPCAESMIQIGQPDTQLNMQLWVLSYCTNSTVCSAPSKMSSRILVPDYTQYVMHREMLCSVSCRGIAISMPALQVGDPWFEPQC